MAVIEHGHRRSYWAASMRGFAGYACAPDGSGPSKVCVPNRAIWDVRACPGERVPNGLSSCRPVDELTEDVGVACVAGSLFEEMADDPAKVGDWLNVGSATELVE